MANRRINKELLDFFESFDLEPKHRHFITGCLKSQKKYPQLTIKQWGTVSYLINYYIAKTINSQTGTVEDKITIHTETTEKVVIKSVKKERRNIPTYVSSK